MVRSRGSFGALIASVAFGLLAFGSAPTAAAETSLPPGQPATVTVRAEGLAETKLPPTQVTTTASPVIKDGNPEHTCPGNGAAGALELATSGNWGGTWFKGLGYSVEGIAGESHVFEAGSKANYFWSFWLDEKEATLGVCEAQLQSGDRILFFPACFGEACPPGSTAPTPLAIEAPASANLGEPVPVTVKKFNAMGKASPAPAATITGASAAVTSDAAGHATVTFSAAGGTVLRASAPESVRTQTTVCVHAGNDGTCGTVGAHVSPTLTTSSATRSTPPYTGPYAIVARATGLVENHLYSRRRAPRLLTGTVSAHTTVTSVSIELRRRYRGRCFEYRGPLARFVRARCGAGSFFQVSRAPTFSYLLPAALAPGRYVLDVEATDAAGNHTKLARGTSRIVFYVR
jgi:hypothetical protein